MGEGNAFLLPRLCIYRDSDESARDQLPAPQVQDDQPESVHSPDGHRASAKLPPRQSDVLVIATELTVSRYNTREAPTPSFGKTRMCC